MAASLVRSQGLWFSVFGLSLGLPEDFTWGFLRAQFPDGIEADRDFLGAISTDIVLGCFGVDEVLGVAIDTRSGSQLFGFGLDPGACRQDLAGDLLRVFDRVLIATDRVLCLARHPDELAEVEDPIGHFL